MDTLITNIGQLVTPVGRAPARGERMGQLTILDGVEIRIHDGRISSIERSGSSSKAKGRKATTQVIDAGGRVALPGLVDAHMHIDAASAGRSPAAASEDDAPWPVLSEEARETRYRSALRRILLNGTTTVELKCADAVDSLGIERSLAMARELSRNAGIRVVPTFLGTPSMHRSGHADRVSTLVTDLIPAVRRQHVAQFCDVSVGGDGYSFDSARTFLRAARGAGLRLKVHGCDSADARIAALAAELEATSVDHLCGVDSVQSARLLRSGTIPVLTPGVSFLWNEPYPDARAMLDAGLPLALGSDYCLAGSGVESMWAVLYFAIAQMGLRTEEAITGATLNAAGTLEMSSEIGTLEPGKMADVIFMDLTSYREIPLCVGRNPVSMVVAAGEVVASS